MVADSIAGTPGSHSAPDRFATSDVKNMQVHLFYVVRRMPALRRYCVWTGPGLREAVGTLAGSKSVGALLLVRGHLGILVQSRPSSRGPASPTGEQSIGVLGAKWLPTAWPDPGVTLRARSSRHERRKKHAGASFLRRSCTGGFEFSLRVSRPRTERSGRALAGPQVKLGRSGGKHPHGSRPSARVGRAGSFGQEVRALSITARRYPIQTAKRQPAREPIALNAARPHSPPWSRVRVWRLKEEKVV
jgi:hypothetical protein